MKGTKILKTISSVLAFSILASTLIITPINVADDLADQDTVFADTGNIIA